MERTQSSLRFLIIIRHLPNNSTNDAIDSDGERDGTRKVVVAKGTINNADNMTVDTGFYLTPKYNVGDYVWEDTNKDGIQDDNEKEFLVLK